jgi:hypothetical protein
LLLLVGWNLCRYRRRRQKQRNDERELHNEPLAKWWHRPPGKIIAWLSKSYRGAMSPSVPDAVAAMAHQLCRHRIDTVSAITEIKQNMVFHALGLNLTDRSILFPNPRLLRPSRTADRSKFCPSSFSICGSTNTPRLFAVCDQTSLVGKTRRKDWLSGANGAVLHSVRALVTL